jgi:glucose/arabinose dehydrogenase
MTYVFSLKFPSRINLTIVTLVLVFILGLSLTLSNSYYYNEDNTFFSLAYAIRAPPSLERPIINDPNLTVQTVYKGLKSPTAMAFLGSDDILVLEKNLGTVQRITNGEILQEPLLRVAVNFADERGLLGIAIANKEVEKNGTSTTLTTDQKITDSECLPPPTSPSSTSSFFSFFDCLPPPTSPSSSSSSPSSVFLFFTEAVNAKDDTPVGNRLYKYELVKDNDNAIKLVNPFLLLDLPVGPAASHVGGMLDIGPDNNLYLTLGDQRFTAYNKMNSPGSQTKAQNYINGKEPDGRASILRITQDGAVVGGEGIVGNEHPLNKYYAYGIKNSFGFDFDPITGNLWDTENGPSFGDEINLVEPGFNSGWASIQGFWMLDDKHNRIGEAISHSISTEEDYNLIDFDGKGQYSSPEFVWDVAPTALKFLNSDRLGKQYENDIFVGDIKNGNLYHFELDEQRKGLHLSGSLADKIGIKDEIEQIIFAQGFGGITDIEIGPDGYLYILTYSEENGTIYRIVPAKNSEEKEEIISLSSTS